MPNGKAIVPYRLVSGEQDEYTVNRQVLFGIWLIRRSIREYLERSFKGEAPEPLAPSQRVYPSRSFQVEYRDDEYDGGWGE